MDKPAIVGGESVRAEPLGYGGQSISQREKEAVLDVLESDYITRGPRVTEFENAVAEYIGVDHAVATTSGTTALVLAGEAAGFGPGDEVITTPLTFIASAYPAAHTGADVVLADVDPETRTLDPEAVERAVTDRTTGLVPMHYGGQPCDIDALLDVADRHDLTVVWDACHALGTERDGVPLGRERDMTMFSFHPVKNITTAEGGMIVTDDDELAYRLRSLRSFDMNYEPPGHDDEPWFQVTEGLGYNYNITDIQAALGVVQLDRLDEFKNRRQAIVDQYERAFDSLSGLATPTVRASVDPMLHLYAVEIEDAFGCSRKQFVHAMHAENIYVQVHYVPLHYHPWVQETYGYEKGEFPQAEAVYDRVVSLPLFPGMDDSDVANVIEAVTRIHKYYA